MGVGWVGEMQNKALLSQLGCSCQLGLKLGLTLGLAELGNTSGGNCGSWVAFLIHEKLTISGQTRTINVCTLK